MTQQSEQIITQNQLLQEEWTIYDPAAEVAFLAVLMKQPDLIVDAERTVPNEHLHIPVHAYVYKIMLFIYRESSKHGWPVNFDPLSMLGVAQFMGEAMKQAFLAKTEGMEKVRAIESMKPHVQSDQFRKYVAHVNDRAARVKMYRHARMVQESVRNFTANPDAHSVALMAEGRFSEVAMQNIADANSKITKLGDQRDESSAKARLNFYNANDGLFNVRCIQFPFWMGLMNGGFKRKGLTIIAARPKVGKSSLLMNIASCLAVQQSVPVLYLDTEMSREELYTREISQISGQQEFDIIRGKWVEDNQMDASIQEAMSRLSNSPFYYVNIAGQPLHHITSLIRQFRNQYVGTKDYTDPATGRVYTFSKQGAVVYDWLKLPDPGSLKSAQEYQLLGFQASAIKDELAKSDLAGIAGAQNNRGAIGVEDADWEEMAESFVAGSDRLAQFCTMLCILRNVSPREADRISTALPARPNRTGANALKYNQLMHVVLQRQGPDYRRGIPLHLDRGLANYAEVADTETMEFIKAMSQSNKQASKAGLPQPQSSNSMPTAAPGPAQVPTVMTTAGSEAAVF